MRVLVKGEWRPGFLDFHRRPTDVRIQVTAWCLGSGLDDLYFVRRRDLRMVLGYVCEVGLRQVGRKIRSRRAESGRNEKWLSIGAGRVLESDLTDLPPGEPVLFIAPRHPVCVERIALPANLVRQLRPDAPFPEKPGTVLHWGPADPGPPLLALAGWDPDSGSKLDDAVVDAAFVEAQRLLSTSTTTAAELPVEAEGTTCERSGQPVTSREPRRRLALFGFGNYAKTVVIPNLGRDLAVACVHEVDPTQIGPESNRRWRWDTAPLPRADEDWDVCVAAGYHHTHAPIAIHALERGADAVIEKPLAVSRGQLEDLLRTARRPSTGRIFGSFQRRHLPCNPWIREDLGDGPISYHCVVYEEPLPNRHWYRWPASGSRILSNGCHWIDHFLFLNEFSAPREWHVWGASSHALSCAVVLSNGAEFTMALTDVGSPRIGLREVIEVRAGEAMARIIDGRWYVAEDARKTVRRARFGKGTAHRLMYRSIAQAISEGGSGDSLESVERSAGLVLDLDELLRSRR